MMAMEQQEAARKVGGGGVHFNIRPAWMNLASISTQRTTMGTPHDRKAPHGSGCAVNLSPDKKREKRQGLKKAARREIEREGGERLSLPPVFLLPRTGKDS